MIRIRVIFWASLSLLAGPLLAYGAEPSWIQLEGDGYRIYSQMPEQATRDWAVELDRFIGAATSILNINRKSLSPLRVVLFKGDKELTAFKTARPDGRVAEEQGGYFYRNESGSYMVLSLQGNREGSRHMLFHEATHWILDALAVRRPLWYEEGLADLFGTYKIEAGQVVFAQPIPGYILEYRSGTFRSLKDFFSREQSMGNNPLETDRYYAQAWAIMHFYFVNPKGRQESADLEKYVRAYAAGEEGDLVDRYFGPRLKAYENALARYIEKETFYLLRNDAKPDPGAATRSITEPIRPDLLNTLSSIALPSADKELVRGYQRALQSEFGGSADVREVGVRIALYRDKDLVAASKLAMEALRKGSTDSLVVRLAADALGHEGTATPARDRQRANMYRTVIARKPANEAAHAGLLGALLTPGVYQSSDGDFVTVGRRLFPRSTPLRLLAGSLHCVRGETDAAVADFDAVIRSDAAPEAAKAEGRRRREAALEKQCVPVDVEALTEMS